jgi:hypothetical protein
LRDYGRGSSGLTMRIACDIVHKVFLGGRGFRALLVPRRYRDSRWAH